MPQQKPDDTLKTVFGGLPPDVQPMCATRAMKVLKYLQRTVPESVPRSSIEALEELPSSVLTSLHAGPDWDTVTKDAQLKQWLTANPIPAPRTKASGPLFKGTLVFVQLIFQEPNQPPASVSLADVQTAVSYAILATQPIQRYASQYGQTSVGVWPNVIPLPASVAGTAFNTAQFEGWVEQAANIVRRQKVENPCIVILHNRDLPHTPQFTGNRNSFDSITSHGTLYCYCLCFGEKLSVADNNHTINGVATEKVYAHLLSHEIAEMVVDPLGNDSNPEVCDGCAGNCNQNLFSLFDANGVFLGGTTNTASATGFAFFINPIVSATAALDSNYCVVPLNNTTAACIYQPPFLSGELLAYGDVETTGNVSNPMVVGFGGWLPFRFLFGGRNQPGKDGIYAVNTQGQLLFYQDSGTQGNVSGPMVVGFGGWLQFKFLFGGRNLNGQNRIYAVPS